ncbi:hypothetical protein ACFSR9_05835 [Deinococcus taklimakanensis]|uniref:HNH endonuclease n=1 Tax=Deinococcus taklimakanensis TaxID=536443 RepID=A0ABW5P1E3_9DEIO
MSLPTTRQQRRAQRRLLEKKLGKHTVVAFVRSAEINAREGQIIRTAMRLQLKEGSGRMRCFICGHSGTERLKMTREHIIPKWILNLHDLHDETLHLLNGSRISYRQLTIPTCVRCNGALSKVEGRLKRAFEARDIVWLRSPAGEDDLIVLASKIYLGLRAKQVGLRDHVNSKDSILLGGDHLESFDPYIFYLLQTARFATSVHGNHNRPGHLPASAVAFRSALDDFMLEDANLGELSLRINGVCVLASLRDGGDARQRLEANNPQLMRRTLGDESGPDREDLREIDELILWTQMGYLSSRRVHDGERLHSFQHDLGHLQIILETGGTYAPLTRTEERTFVADRLRERGFVLEFREDAPPASVWL